MRPSGVSRIAFVIPRFSEHGTVGGAETLLKCHAQRLAAAGRRVTVLTTCATDHVSWANVLPAGRREVAGLDAHFFPVDPRDAALWERLSLRLTSGRPSDPRDEDLWLRNGWNSSALCRHLASHGAGFDRIVAGPYLFGLVIETVRMFAGRTVLTPCLHDEPFAYLAVVREMFAAAGGLVFNTATEHDLARKLYRLPPDRGVVVGMGIDDFDADPRAFARRAGLTSPYVIYSGRREEGKGTPLLFDYLTLFRERTGRDVKLVLTGNGEVVIPPALRPHVIDLGFVSETEKYEAMAGAVAFIHPSVLESLGIVLLEAWMARTPTLVHACSPVLRRQCVRANAGLWFSNYPEFEAELILLLDQPELRDRLGNNGREFVRRAYAWPAVDRRLLQALTQGGPSA